MSLTAGMTFYDPAGEVIEDIVLIALNQEEYDFITKFDPDRDRSASRHQLVEVLTHIQSVVIESRVP